MDAGVRAKQDARAEKLVQRVALINLQVANNLREQNTPEYARVVKLVDTGDLKSPDHCDRAGSSPAPGTTSYIDLYPVN